MSGELGRASARADASARGALGPADVSTGPCAREPASTSGIPTIN